MSGLSEISVFDTLQQELLEKNLDMLENIEKLS